MKPIDICPFVRYARLHKKIGYTEPHRCYDCRLFVFLKGEGTLSAGEQSFTFSKGNAIFLPPGSVYRFVPSESDIPTSLYALDFDLTSDYAHLSESRRTPELVMFDESAILETDSPSELSEPRMFFGRLPEIEGSLSEICTLLLRRTPMFAERASGLLKDVLAKLLASGNEREDGLCERVLAFIYENYRSPELSNAVIASHFGYHPYHLGSIVKSKTGKTLHRHLLEYRLAVSADMLVTGECDVSEIFWQCGFSSASHYIKAFGDYFGTTPMRYRKTQGIGETR